MFKSLDCGNLKLLISGYKKRDSNLKYENSCCFFVFSIDVDYIMPVGATKFISSVRFSPVKFRVG